MLTYRSVVYDVMENGISLVLSFNGLTPTSGNFLALNSTACLRMTV